MRYSLLLWLLPCFSACYDSSQRVSPPLLADDNAVCEHGLQRAICTKCNPSLIPVFQAKGNFCEEHGFPESFCPICHPEKKGKLAVDLTAKEEAPRPPEDGTRVKLKDKEIARLAGLQIVKVLEDPGSASLTATATIAYDATRYAQLNARASGVVRELLVDLGAEVERKDSLAVIQSASVGADRSKLKGASAALEVAKENHQRVKGLVAQGLSAQKDLLVAKAELDAAQADYLERAASLGEIDAGARLVGGYTLTSPIPGVVVRKNLSLGQLVSTEEILFEVADTSFMWAEIEIPETDISLVSLSQEVVIQVDGLPGREFRGRLSYLSPEVDRQTRTIKARAALENPDGALRANMFANALFFGAQRGAVVVPREALQTVRGATLVFVRLAEDLYEVRYVTALPDRGDGDLIGISKGLTAGEEVVTEGGFLLKTETMKDSIGAGCCAEE